MTDYESKRKLTRREGLRYGAALGAIVMAGGGGHYLARGPSMPPSLEREAEINRELNRNLDVNLDNLESKSKEFIDYAKKLKVERGEIISNPNYAKVKDAYVSERDKVHDRGFPFFLGGLVLYLGPLLLSELSKEKYNSEDKKLLD